MEEIFKEHGITSVVNFAAESHIDRNIEDLITYVKNHPGHDVRYAINNTKIITELDWQPSYTFGEGIKEAIQWYLDNSEWISNLSKVIKQSFC